MTPPNSPIPARERPLWDALTRELDCWAADGRRAALWWRDDDATRPGPRLDRLLAAAAGIPLALAVIAAAAEPALARRLASEDDVAVLQHGFRHRNHAPAGEKKSELGPHRPLAAVRRDLDAGRRILSRRFGRRFLPILAPPWNRIGAPALAVLGDLGYAAVSGFGRGCGAAPVAPIDAQLDLVDWRCGRGFVGTARALGGLLSLLRAGRTAPPAAPTAAPPAFGLLTHHRNSDDDTWRFLDRLAAVTRRHPGAHWRPVAALAPCPLTRERAGVAIDDSPQPETIDARGP